MVIKRRLAGHCPSASASGERWDIPTCPVTRYPLDTVPNIVRHKHIRIRIRLSEQELVEERIQETGLIRWESAVRVSSLLHETEIFFDAQSRENSTCSGHASEVADGTQPDKIGVIEDEETARGDKCRKEMVIDGQNVERVDEVGEVGREPNILLDDFCRRLNNFARLLFEE